MIRRFLLFLTMTLTLCLNSWAEFIPEVEKTYYLYAVTPNAYLKFQTVAGVTTQASFQPTGDGFKITKVDNQYVLECANEPGQYLSTTSNSWDIGKNTTATKWYISETGDGCYYIKLNNESHYLGNNGNSYLGAGIFHSGSAVNATWRIVETNGTTALGIPDANIEDNWNTIKTNNGYYYYAYQEEGIWKLGQTNIDPNPTNYALYCWKIEGNEAEGYSFRNLYFEDDQSGKRYITLPPSPVDVTTELLITTERSRFYYSNNTLQPVDFRGHYLVFYSKDYKTIRLYSNQNYSNKNVSISGLYQYNITAQTPSGISVPGGGVTYNNHSYHHGSTLYAGMNPAQSTFHPINVSGYSTASITQISQYDPKTGTPGSITVSYTPTYSEYTYKNIAKDEPISGETKTILLLDPANYITNTSGKFSYVPAGKAWQMEIDMLNTGSITHFNQYGSCIIASSADPTNTYYNNDFQIFQHQDNGTLNFKSSKGDGMRHIIAQGTSVENKNYKITIRYDGGQVYLIRTQIGDETYNNVWYAARVQQDIMQMSAALAAGQQIESLKISIAEVSNLMENIDYALINKTTNEYISCNYNGGKIENWLGAEHSAQFQIEFTGEDLAYHDTDGALHSTFLLKIQVYDLEQETVVTKYVSSSNNNSEGGNTTITLSDNKNEAIPFLYSENTFHLTPVTKDQSGTYSILGDAWKFGNNDTWDFDFYAWYMVDVKRNGTPYNDFGGLRYKTTTAHNGEQIYLPASISSGQWNNISEEGYKTVVSKGDMTLHVAYTALADGFYNITKISDEPASTVLYSWTNEEKLVKYPEGTLKEWNENDSSNPFASGIGDVFHYTIEPATSFSVNVSKNKNTGAKDGFHYGSLYSPSAVTLPEGIKAFIATLSSDGSVLLMHNITVETQTIPAKTPVVLRSDDETETDPISITLSIVSSPGNTFENNVLQGQTISFANPNNNSSDPGNVYLTLGRTNGIGFYRYTGSQIGGFKAYLKLPKSSSNNARISFDFTELETSANEIPVETTYIEGSVYDITGRKVSKLIKGNLYINNGKKFIY